jgi:ADP-heptose:LPS heptosyltransferase
MERIIQKLKNREINKVLFIRLRSIGDTVLLTPSIKAFKAAYPHCHLAVLMENPSAEVLVDNPNVDELIILNHKKTQKQSQLKTLYDQLGCYLSLMRKKFDIVFNFHGGSRSIYLTLVTLAKYRIGHQNYRFKFIYSHVLYDIKRMLDIERLPHAVENQYAMVKWTGANGHKIELDIPFSAKYKEKVRHLLEAKKINSNSRYMVFHPYTPKRRKRFPIAYLAELVNRLYSELKINIILTYGANEKGTIEELAALTTCSPIVFEEPFHLKMVAELIRNAILFVGCDSGVMHIAAAVGTPVVALFNGSNCRRWYPWCEKYLIVHHNMSTDNCENCSDKISSCINFLDHDKILSKIKPMLKEDAQNEYIQAAQHITAKIF